MNEHAQEFSPIAAGCFRDSSTQYRTEGGQWCFLEFTPILSPALSPDPSTGAPSFSVDTYGFESTYDIRDWEGANALATNSVLAGGGWRLASVLEEVSLRDYDSWAPASKVLESPAGGFVHTRTRGGVAPPNYGPLVLFVSGGFPNSDASTQGLARGSRFVAVEGGSLVVHDHTPQLEPIGDGCFRDLSRLYKNQDGDWCFLECTPVLGPLEELSREEAFAVVEASTLSGGGWRVSSVKEEVALRRYPAGVGVPGDPSVFLITRSAARVSSCWGIGLDRGHIGTSTRIQSRYFLRGTRLVHST